MLGYWDTGMSSAVLTALLMLFYECALRFFFFFFAFRYFATK